MQETLINLGLLALATFFIMLGAALVMRGTQRRAKRFAYDVGRVEARGSALISWVQGFVLLSIGVVLFAFWAFYNPNEAATEATPAELVSVETKIKPTIVLDTSGQSPEEATVSVGDTLVETSLEAATVTTSTQNTPLPPTPVPTLPPPTEIPETATPTPIPPPTATPGPATDGTVNIIGGLNLRNAPGGQIVTLIENGEGVFFLGGEQEEGVYIWIEVETIAGDVGWVASDFVTVNEP